MSIMIGIKIISSVGIIGSSSVIGFLKSKQLVDDVSTINDLKFSVNFMLNEIVYRKSDLRNLLLKAINNTENKKLVNIYSSMLDNLKEDTPEDSIKLALKELDLNKKIKRIINDLFSHIGKNDVEGELNNIKLIIANLDQLEKEMIIARDKYSRLYQTVGVVGGLGITMLLN